MEFLFELQKKENKKTKKFSKITTVDEPEPSVQSKRTETGRFKQRKCIWYRT